MAGHDGGTFVVFMAFLMNLCVSIVKGIVAFLTGSSAMAAETVHSLADTGNQVLLLIGIKQSKKGACDKHPYGRGKESYFWAFIVTICLFTIGACYSIYEGIHKILHPPEAFDHMIWAYVVLVVSMLLESVALRAAFVEVKKRKGRKPYIEFVRRSKNIEVVVVFLEDIAALMGLMIAMLGLLAAQLTGMMFFDGLASILIGLLLVVVAYMLAKEVKSLLVGESANLDNLRVIYKILSTSKQIEKVISVETLQMGPVSFIAAIKADFMDNLKLEEVETEINRLEEEIRTQIPQAYKIYIEPDKYQPNYCNGNNFSTGLNDDK